MNQASSVIIRLQRLPWEAASADVREFFRGLSIPDGGVHIIGGRDGDAFIAFSTDEDARQAMRMDGKRIKGAKVKLYLSSRVEMQQVIDKARMELQQGMPPPSSMPQGESKEKSKRRRSRSPDRPSRRRSRSRSPVKSSSKTSPSEVIKSGPPPNVPSGLSSTMSGLSNVPSAASNLPPGASCVPSGVSNTPSGPANVPAGPNVHSGPSPLAAFNSFRGELGDGQRFDRRSVLDRSAPPPNFTANFLDRSGPVKGRHVGVPDFPPPHVDPNVPFRPPHTDKFHRDPRSHINVPGAAQMNVPGSQMNVPGSAPINIPGSADLPPRGVLPPPGFMASGPPRMERGFEGGLDHLFNAQQPPPAVGRASRRALLPAPEDTPGSPGDEASGRRHPEGPPVPFPPQLQQRPPPIFTQQPPPHLSQPPPHADWTLEKPTIAPFIRPSLLIAPPSVTNNDSGLCVLMSAVPSSMQRYGGIRDFFTPLNLDGPDKIKIVADERGKRTGQVYCKFLTLEDANVAVSYNGKENIYIRACTDAEFDAVVDGGLIRRRSRSRERDVEGAHTRDDSRQRSSAGGDRSGIRDDEFVIEIKNIPYKATQAHLKRYMVPFNPLEIRRVYKHHATTGQICTSDTAYVIFANERDMTAALRNHDRILLDREVRISRTSMGAMESTFKRAPAAPPEAVAEWAVKESRREYRDRYHVDRRPRHRSRSRSRSPPVARSPPPPRRGRSPSPKLPYELPSSPYRPPRPSKKDVPEPSPDPTVPTASSSPHRRSPVTCVFMKGMPMNATNRDVASFFNGLHIAQNGIRILKSVPGVAYVEFLSPADCEQALKKDRSYVGTQMVSVWPCTKEEMMEAVHKQLGLNGGGGAISTNTTIVSNDSNQQQPMNDQPMKPDLPETSTQQLLTSDPVANFDMMSASLYDHLGDLLVQESKPNQPVQVTPSSSSSSTEQNGNTSVPLNDIVPIDLDVLCSIGAPGCVAALHNLPTEITLEEICQLFQKYQLIDDSVRMHYSNTGEPTGDCLLAFATATDAQAAASELNGTVISGKTLRIYVVPV